MCTDPLKLFFFFLSLISRNREYESQSSDAFLRKLKGGLPNFQCPPNLEGLEDSMQINGTDNPFGNIMVVSPSCLGAVIRAPGGPALPLPGVAFGRDQEPSPSPPAAFCVSISAGEGAGDHQVLQVSGEARRLGVGAELCDHRPQQPLVQATLYRQRQLCPHVSAILGPSPTLGNPGLPEGAGGGHCWVGEAWDTPSAPQGTLCWEPAA